MGASGPGNVNGFDPGASPPEVRRCRRCGVRKAAWAFYREKTCRGGRRPECKRCHAGWKRGRYVPETGRRNRTRRDRAEEEAAAARARPAHPASD